MAGKKKKTKEDIVRIAMEMAAARGWADLSLSDIAAGGGLSLAGLHEMFEDKSDILAALGRMIDRAVLENAAAPGADEDMPVRDRLFEVMMERFDALNDYRAGIVSVLDSFIPDPKQAVISLPHLCRSMTWMLEAAGVETTGISGALKVAGLSGVYLNVLRVWKDDESADMAKTMAALDKSLGHAEKIVDMIGL